MCKTTHVNSYNELYDSVRHTIYGGSYSKVLFLTDKNIYELYKNVIENMMNLTEVYSLLYIIKPGEKSKSLDTTKLIVKELIENSFNRDSIIVNIGGGVVSDLGGFIASNYLRGIDYINIPTTIIGQVDAAIGGKTAINMFNIKNNFGNFHNPINVIILTQFIKTLSDIEKYNGYGEMFKYAVLIGDMNIIKQEYDEIYDKCVKYKKKIVEQDLYDNGVRKKLNLGHTLGHGLESLLNIPHGIAVVYGILFASYLYVKLDNVQEEFFNQLCEVSQNLIKYKKINLKKVDIDSLVNKLILDKKSTNGQIQWILPFGWGKTIIKQIEKEKWINLLKSFMEDGIYEKCINN